MATNHTRPQQTTSRYSLYWLFSSISQHNRSRLLTLLALFVSSGLVIFAGCNGSGLKGDSLSPGSTTLISGGLGLTKAEWEQRHTLTATDNCSFYRYDPPLLGDHLSGSKYDFYEYYPYGVTFWHEAGRSSQDARISGMKADLRRVLSETQHMRLEAMEYLDLDKKHMAVRALLPADVQLQQTIPDQGLKTILLTEVYHSKSLESVYPSFAFAPKPWKGKEPGAIYVSYLQNGRDAQIEADLVTPLPCPSPTPAPPTPTPSSPPPPVPTVHLPKPLKTHPPLPIPSVPITKTAAEGCCFVYYASRLR